MHSRRLPLSCWVYRSERSGTCWRDGAYRPAPMWWYSRAAPAPNVPHAVTLYLSYSTDWLSTRFCSRSTRRFAARSSPLPLAPANIWVRLPLTLFNGFSTSNIVKNFAFASILASFHSEIFMIIQIVSQKSCQYSTCRLCVIHSHTASMSNYHSSFFLKTKTIWNNASEFVF